MNKETDYFNCSEAYEHAYVVGLYKEKEAVKRWLKEKCADGTIHYTTHAELYKMLAKAGFTKIA